MIVSLVTGLIRLDACLAPRTVARAAALWMLLWELESMQLSIFPLTTSHSAVSAFVQVSSETSCRRIIHYVH